jgi:hypothetical protein
VVKEDGIGQTGTRPENVEVPAGGGEEGRDQSGWAQSGAGSGRAASPTLPGSGTAAGTPAAAPAKQ